MASSSSSSPATWPKNHEEGLIGFDPPGKSFIFRAIFESTQETYWLCALVPPTVISRKIHALISAASKELLLNPVLPPGRIESMLFFFIAH